MKILRHILTAIYIAILGSIGLLFLAMDDIYRFFRDKINNRHDNKINRNDNKKDERNEFK